MESLIYEENLVIDVLDCVDSKIGYRDDFDQGPNKYAVNVSEIKGLENLSDGTYFAEIEPTFEIDYLRLLVIGNKAFLHFIYQHENEDIKNYENWVARTVREKIGPNEQAFLDRLIDLYIDGNDNEHAVARTHGFVVDLEEFTDEDSKIMVNVLGLIEEVGQPVTHIKEFAGKGREYTIDAEDNSLVISWIED